MAILRERKTWRRPRPARLTARPDELTPEEQAEVRAFVRMLRGQLGSWRALASAMRVKQETLEQAVKRPDHGPTAGIALRAARVAGIHTEVVLSGRWTTLRRVRSWRPPQRT